MVDLLETPQIGVCASDAAESRARKFKEALEEVKTCPAVAEASQVVQRGEAERKRLDAARDRVNERARALLHHNEGWRIAVSASRIPFSDSTAYTPLPTLNLFSAASQSTTFHHAEIYSGRRF